MCLSTINFVPKLANYVYQYQTTKNQIGFHDPQRIELFRREIKEL